MSDSDDARDGATPDECVEADGPETIDELLNTKQAFTPLDAYHEAFGEAPALPIVMTEGLPTVQPHDANPAHVPALSHEEFVCLADETYFVWREHEWGEVLARFTPGEVDRRPYGWRVTGTLFWERLRETHSDTARRRLVEDTRGMPGKSEEWVRVMPQRPTCKHLVQQLHPPQPNEITLRFGWLQRLCSVRRSMSGAFMELTNSTMRACSVRDPRDSASEQMIDRMAAHQIELGKDRVYLPLFSEAPKETNA